MQVKQRPGVKDDAGWVSHNVNYDFRLLKFLKFCSVWIYAFSYIEWLTQFTDHCIMTGKRKRKKIWWINIPQTYQSNYWYTMKANFST